MVLTKYIVFSDFDGTITLQDSNDYLTDNVGIGSEQRRKLNCDVLQNRSSFRDAFKEMLDSVKLSFTECIELLRKNIKLDPGFKAFFDWCLQHDITVIILSSGMEPIIRALLKDLIGPSAEKIQIVSNSVDIHKNGSWNIVFHDDSHFGHDKSLAIKPYSSLPKGQRPTLFYCGDGVSDLSAAAETDLLFAKAGQDLITYCRQENIPYREFIDFTEIHSTIRSIVEGKSTVKEVAVNK
ncbi:Pdp3-interacting factor 1 [Neolecta irregularis DAH-3]|uniref:Pdp3-interacting factor 1 n=1 Tax=Neolecta irregularis (strain DAH-3) TaxID=1198029 RepID=A0A1U7LK74_NEOID|nr:Pdp3-interacting factor 1 [Neolecta irregularis DAH-3]|eukprot:OLL22993.1 Pdp3-interacting factor 1 [Neolecta irregularis DAH-3]